MMTLDPITPEQFQRARREHMRADVHVNAIYDKIREAAKTLTHTSVRHAIGTNAEHQLIGNSVVELLHEQGWALATCTWRASEKADGVPVWIVEVRL